MNPKSVLRDFGDYKDTVDAGKAKTVSASITSGNDAALHSGDGDFTLLTATDSDCRLETSEGNSLLWFENAGKELAVLAQVVMRNMLDNPAAIGGTIKVIAQKLINQIKTGDYHAFPIVFLHSKRLGV